VQWFHRWMPEMPRRVHCSDAARVHILTVSPAHSQVVMFLAGVLAAAAQMQL